MSLNILTRQRWHARFCPLGIPELEFPVTDVYCCYSGTVFCRDRHSCISQVKKLQKFHIYHKSLRDIRYNFLLGGDGNVYEGRGWLCCESVGDSKKSYSTNSIMIALIGSFKDRRPPDIMFEKLDEFLNYAVRSGFIKEGFKQHISE